MSNEFLVQKGFLDEFSVFKGDGHASDTLPSDPGSDVTDSAKLDSAAVDKTGANIKPGENKPGGPGTTMADDLSEVADEAKKDIEATYVSDPQKLGGEKNEIEKGWESYNHMVEKGFVVDQNSFSRYDIDGSFDTIEKSVHNQLAVGEPDSKWMVAKELGDNLVVEKSALGAAGAIALPIAAGAGMYAGMGAAGGALGAGKGKRKEGAKRGVREAFTPGALFLPKPVYAGYRKGQTLREKGAPDVVEKAVVPGPGKVYGPVSGKLAELARRAKLGQRGQAAAEKVGEATERSLEFAKAHPYATGAVGGGLAGVGVGRLSKRREEKGTIDVIEKTVTPGPGKAYGSSAGGRAAEEWQRTKMAADRAAKSAGRTASQGAEAVSGVGSKALGLAKRHPVLAGAAILSALGAAGYGGYRSLRKEKGMDEDDLVFKCSSTIRVPKGKVKK